MLTALQSVATLFLVIGAGMLLARRGFFDEASGALFSRVVIGLSLPLLMVHDLVTGFTRSALLRSGPGLLIPVLSMGTMALLAPLAARLGGVAPGRRGTFAAMFTASNSVFIGLPVNLALFGPAAVPSVLLFYAVNISYFWTLGVHGIEADAGNRLPFLSPPNLRRILSPPFVAFFVGVLLVLLELRLPAFLLAAMKHLGGMTTPLSLLFIGITFAGVTLAELKPTRETGVLLAGRFLLMPGLTLLLCMLLPVDPLAAKVFVVQAGMPAITQAALAARGAGADYRYASVQISATNLAFLFFLPLYTVILAALLP